MKKRSLPGRYCNLFIAAFLITISQFLQASCGVEEQVEFNLPSQELKNALIQLSILCNLTLIVQFDELQNIHSKSVQGAFTAGEALNQMLANTNLAGKISDKNIIEINNANPKRDNPISVSRPIQHEEVMVTGFRHSLHSATTHKKESSVIEDVITEYDIVKMPDRDVAESLQRIPGINIEKRLGEGSKINIRGFNENLTLLNGETFLAGMEYFQLGWNDQDYEGSLEAIPIEMLSRIHVSKSFKASDIEGSAGGTVNLIGRNPFEITDSLVVVETGTDVGRYSQDAQPYVITTLGKNWNDVFAINMALSTHNKTSHVDFSENYLDRPIINETLSIPPCIDEFIICIPTDDQTIYSIPPHLSPRYQKTADIEQQRERTSINSSFGYRPTDNLEFALDITRFRNLIKQRDYEIWYKLTDIESNEPFRLNTNHRLPFIIAGTYSQEPQKFSTIAQTVESNGKNVLLGTTWTATDSLILHGTLAYSKASYDQALGNAEVFYQGASTIDRNIASEIGQLPVWVGDSGVEPINEEPIFTPTGWVGYNLVCFVCQYETPQLVDYDNQQFSFSQYRNSDYHSRAQNALSTYARANSINVSQSAWTVKGDALWEPDNSRYNFTFGWRFANRKLVQNSYRYLANLAETQDAAEVAQFDASGNLVSESTFDRLTPADNFNVGVKEAYYSDLCNNGGILVGNECDIDGDGLDDNLPYGPWTYALDAVDGLPSFVGGLTSDGISTLLNLLYSGRLNNINSAAFLPGNVPWQTYLQNPAAYTRLTNYLPSQNFQGNVYFIDAQPILGNPGKWIDERSPHSPTKKFLVPRNSFSVNQSTAAIYSELNFESERLPYSVNAGLRLVKTETIIGSNIINEQPKVSLTGEDWEISGVGSGWSGKEEKKRYLDLLPSANLIWDFDQHNKLRLSAGKSITRPNLQLLGQGFTPTYRRDTPRPTNGLAKTIKVATGGRVGNPNLKPEKVTQADVSYEHYYGLSNYLQLAVFAKKIDGEILQGIIDANVADESFEGFTLVPVSIPLNARQSSVKGIEFALQNSWDSGFGVNVNYTFIDSQSDLESFSRKDYGIPGISKHTLNLASFFETDSFSIRLATNWRSEYVDPYNTTTQFENFSSRTFEETENFGDANLVRSYLPFLQADARATWTPRDNIRFTFDVLNINNKPQRTYLEYKENISSNFVVETHYVIGAKISLH